MSSNPGLVLPGQISSAPITPEDIVRSDESIAVIHEFREAVCDPVIRAHLDTVLRLASDGLCNLCHELGSNPNEIEYRHL